MNVHTDRSNERSRDRSNERWHTENVHIDRSNERSFKKNLTPPIGVAEWALISVERCLTMIVTDYDRMDESRFVTA